MQPFELHSGDSMMQSEFHSIYKLMPEGFKAELIGGVVYVASPLKQSHAEYHSWLNSVLMMYVANTPGLQLCDNATVILGHLDELQPDILIRIRPSHGGQSSDTEDDYIQGAPEFVLEIAHTSSAIDLHSKRERYLKSGVREYIVLCLRPRELFWFDLSTNPRLEADSDGLYRSKILPGLWLNLQAILDINYSVAMESIKKGLESAAHAEFAATLAKK